MRQSQKYEEYIEWEIELAKRILCSTVSVQMGISYQHCWKTYIEPGLEEKELGALYLECARMIRENLHQDSAKVEPNEEVQSQRIRNKNGQQKRRVI